MSPSFFQSEAGRFASLTLALLLAGLMATAPGFRDFAPACVGDRPCPPSLYLARPLQKLVQEIVPKGTFRELPRTLLVNTVVGFIGPEYLFDGKQIIRAGLEDHFCGKLLGLPMGVDVCYTNHAEADQNDMDVLLTLLGIAGHFVFEILPRTYHLKISGGDLLSNRHFLARSLQSEATDHGVSLQVIPAQGSQEALALLDQAPEIRGASCLDPMSGDGRMMARFAPRFKTLITNDLDPATPAQHHLDAVGGGGMALWLREPVLQQTDLSSLRLAGFGGAPMAPATQLSSTSLMEQFSALPTAFTSSRGIGGHQATRLELPGVPLRRVGESSGISASEARSLTTW